MSKKVKMTFNLDKELKKEVQIKCIREERKLTEVLTQLLQDYVEE